MKKIYQLFLTVFFIAGFTASSFAQQSFFSDVNESAIKLNSANTQRVIKPQKYRTVSMSSSTIKNFLWSLPSEDKVNRLQAPILELPMPDGKTAKFRVWESSLMEPALAAKFPEMKTFAGQGIDDPYATIRFDYNPYFGFHAQILSTVTGRIYIDPFARGDIEHYISYFTRDNAKIDYFTCATENLKESVNDGLPPAETNVTGPCRGLELYTYRLALACTGEYAVAVCAPNAPTVPATAAAMLTTVNRVTGVYETDMALRLVLVANNNNLIYLDGNTDPYTNNSGTAMLSQNQTNVDAIIGSANYDIGHVVSTGGGGVASLRVPCTASKARGVTGLPNPVGDNFDIDYVAHEMGHQWGGNHTFNSSASNCGGGNRNANTAYEVGSGTSIQAYAGICAGDNTQPHSDPFFHSISFDEISNNIFSGNSSTCGVRTATGNTLPVITSMSNNGASIPVNTPFTLTGAATDANNDPITYNWEEWDLGPSTVWNGGNTTTTAPLFKSRPPKISGSRTFPDISFIAANYVLTAQDNNGTVMGGNKGETLPTVARALKFRLTVRDSRAGGGGIVTGGDGCQTGFTPIFQISTIAGATFAVTAPNGGESYAGGSTQTVTWSNTNTTTAPISVANVKISFSTDGGLTYPTVLVASTANDGSESVVIPVGVTTTARVKVEAVGNVFFDISNANFNVTNATNPTFTFVTPSSTSVACGGPATAAITLATTSVGSFVTPINLVAGTLPGGTSVTYSVNPVTPGNSTVVTLNGMNTLTAGTYPIVITGTAGAEVKQVTLTYIVTAGSGPAITAQPATPVTICAGANASFAITSAAATSFQWQVSTDNGNNWSNLANTAPYSGVTTNTLIITGAPATLNNYQYRAIAGVQCGTTTSSAGVLIVNAAPSVSNNPAASTVCTGTGTSFSVTASGAGLNYQWQFSTAGAGGPWNPVPNAAPYSGVTSNTLSISATTLAMNSYRYRVVVTGTCPPAITTPDGLLTVIDPVTVATSPSDVIVCTPGNATFTATGNSTVTIIYQWQESTAGAGGPWNNITNGGVYSGANTGTLTLTGVPPTMNTYRYRALLSNATCTSPATTASALLTVQVAPAITANPAAATVCLGNTATFTGAASGTNVNYQWQLSTAGAGGPWSNVPAAAPYTGVTSGTLTINPTSLALNGNYYRLVATGSCSPAANTTGGLLTVIAPVAITAQPAAAAVCNTYNRSFSVTASSTVPINYQWQVSTAGAGGPWNDVTNTGVYSGATTNTLTITGATLAMNNYQYRVQVSNATCTSPTISNPVVLTVNPLPAVAATANPTSVCTGTPSTLTATGADTYVWGTGTTPATGAIVVVTPVVAPANPSVPLTTTYSVVGTITATGCFNNTTVSVIAEPLPVVTLAPTTPAALLPGQTVTLTASVVPAGGNFTLKWFKDGADINFGGTSRVITVNDLGSYKVTVANAVTGLCSTTSNTVVVAAAPSPKLFVYPNPNSGIFTVAYYNASTAATTQGITVYDSKGSIVYNAVFPVTQPYQLHKIDIRKQGGGLYHIILRDANGKKVKTAAVIVR